MAQIVIDGVLFSPVLAHALEPGDLVRLIGTTRHVLAVSHESVGEDHVSQWLIIDTMDAQGADQVSTEINFPVLRAVGARANRGGAR